MNPLIKMNLNLENDKNNCYRSTLYLQPRFNIYRSNCIDNGNKIFSDKKS